MSVEKISSAVVTAYTTIQNGVVKGYLKIQDTAVSGYKKVENACVKALFTKKGETVEEAKARLTCKEGK